MKKVLASGRFNIIHPGHVKYLEKAKMSGMKQFISKKHLCQKERSRWSKTVSLKKVIILT